MVVVPLRAQISFSFQQEYQYLKGSQASGIPSDWMDPGFDDSGWSAGNAPFWYGDGTGGTELTDMSNTYSTMYMRAEFSATNAENINEITFTIDYDDGFVIWINGEEAVSQLAPSVRSYDAFATDNHESGTAETFVINANDVNLNEGINTIAIQGFNVSLESSDFHFDAGITAGTDTPAFSDTLGLTFSRSSGFYNDPFTLTISTPHPDVQIVYTLDGSNPQTSVTGYTGGTSVDVTIDPSGAAGRSLTPGVVVRASVSKAGFIPSIPEARTYLFLDNVKTQTYPGGNWPDYDVNGQVIDLDMDADIVNDSRYTDEMDDALKDIPTISIVTDITNLFDPATGIYVNADGHGYEWERECSVEMFNDPESDGFNVNAGLRIRGGWSRHDNYPKHAFRLFFREEYGYPKLDFPLFGDEGTDTYDKVDLRTAQNYAWSNGDGRNTMVHEVFSRDSQRDTEQPYTRSRYYHLYLNGMYWGIFQTQERSEARYASDYLGGKREDWDVVKVSTENYSYRVEATDGNTAAWEEVWDRCNDGFEDNDSYFDLEGKHGDGTPKSGSEVLVDIDNLIDYMIGIFYTGNFDAPTSSFGSNKGPNNFYVLNNRNDKSQGFVFFNHDAEHSLMYDAASPGIGINENRVDIADRTDDMEMQVDYFDGFHPQWLHYKLTENAEYRLRFADRAYRHLTGDGAYTPDKCRERFNKRVEEIENAIIAESARWGDVGPQPGYNKDDNWLPRIQTIRNQFFNYRTNIVIEQLQDEELFTEIIPPRILSGGNPLSVFRYTLNSPLTIEFDNQNSGGTIYYTLDGSDPRHVGGDIGWKAIETENGSTLDINASAVIKARVYDNGEWSALKQITFLSNDDDYSKLKVTELHYHPADHIVGTDTTKMEYEFIEFKNTGQTAINLSGLVLDSAVYYVFPPNTVLPPRSFYVIASEPDKFYEKYGMIASGVCKGHFSNGGEEVLLETSSGTEILRFTYSDSPPWNPRADGNGYSLVSDDINPTGDPANPDYWRSSFRIDGSPFHDDDGLDDLEFPEYISQNSINIYPNPVSDHLYIEYIAPKDNVKMEVRMFDLSGELIYQSTESGSTVVNFTGLNATPGIYIVNVVTDTMVKNARILYTP
jgi:hypothetical protein